MACSRMPLVMTGNSSPSTTTAIVAHQRPDEGALPTPQPPPRDGGGSPGRVGRSRVVRATAPPSHRATGGCSSRRVGKVDSGEPQAGGVDLGRSGQLALGRPEPGQAGLTGAFEGAVDE